MTFGEKITYLREQKNMSQTELAKKMNIGRRTLVSWECEGRHPKSREAYQKLANILDCDANYLLMLEPENATEAKDADFQHMKAILEQAKVYFAGAKLPEGDRLQFMLDIQEIYYNQKKQKDNKQG